MLRRRSTISNLPPELLLEVFEQVVASTYMSSDLRSGTWALMEVCSSWRKLVCSSAILWSYIAVRQDSFRHLEVFLERSANRPLMIVFHSDISSSLVDKLMLQAHRWREAHLILSSEQLISLNRVRLFPVLRRMTLAVRKGHVAAPTFVALSDAPCLIEFAGVIRITGIRLALPWSQLTLLELDESRGSLTLLPSVSEGDSDSEHLELPSLRVIHSIDEPTALERLLAPNLRHIVLSHGQDPFDDGASGNQRIYHRTFQLLQRSHCNIEKVEFRVPTHGTKLSSRGVERILQQSRSVQVRFVIAHINSISNIDWGHLGSSFTFERLQTLSLRVARHRAFCEESGMLVPEINRTLEEDTKEYFRDSDMDFRVLEEYRRNAGALLDMLESRSRLPELQNVYLDFADSPYLHWFTVPQVVDRLRRLVNRDMVYVQIQGVNFSKLSFVGWIFSEAASFSRRVRSHLAQLLWAFFVLLLIGPIFIPGYHIG